LFTKWPQSLKKTLDKIWDGCYNNCNNGTVIYFVLEIEGVKLFGQCPDGQKKRGCSGLADRFSERYPHIPDLILSNIITYYLKRMVCLQ